MSELFGTSEIAQMYHVTNATVLNWIHAGKLKAFTTPGGHYRVARDDLNEFARTYSAPPTIALEHDLRLLLVGSDAEFYSRLRSAVLFRWPQAQIEHARTEFEIGWWLARLDPTHLIIHPRLTPGELLEHCRRLTSQGIVRDIRLAELPDSIEDGLSQWVDHLDSTHV
jgi:excisionase family DNA binding protein